MSVRVRYQTYEFGDVDIHLRTLRDRQQFDDRDGEAEALGILSAQWPLFGVVWSAGEALARHMFDYDITGLRILEIGCGIGLTSLVLNRRNADITATDHHPEAERFLQQNTRLNTDPDIPFARIDWSKPQSSLGRFDLIIGSDLLYEQGLSKLLATFIEHHAQHTCTVILTDPRRGNSNRFSRHMIHNGYSLKRRRALPCEHMVQPFSGHFLHYTR